MARQGYLEAKRDAARAAANVQACEVSLNEVDSLPYITVLKDIHRKDRQRNLEDAKAESARADAVLASFDIKSSVGTRVYFDTRIQLCVLMSDDLRDAFVARRQADNISAAELTRRALAAYLKKSDNA